MQLPFRRGLTPKQQFARGMVREGLSSLDPTQWSLYAKDAGYTKNEAQNMFARYLELFAANPHLPQPNKEAMLNRIERLKRGKE